MEKGYLVVLVAAFVLKYGETIFTQEELRAADAVDVVASHLPIDGSVKLFIPPTVGEPGVEDG